MHFSFSFIIQRYQTISASGDGLQLCVRVYNGLWFALLCGPHSCPAALVLTLSHTSTRLTVRLEIVCNHGSSFNLAVILLIKLRNAWSSHINFFKWSYIQWIQPWQSPVLLGNLWSMDEKSWLGWVDYPKEYLLNFHLIFKLSK